MRLDSTTASATFSLTRGGRLASLIVHGSEVLITAGDDEVFGWGSFPLVPYAGRVADGAFSFRNTAYRLPVTMAPHAIHGVALRQAWTQTSSTEITTQLGPPWPLGGSATQRATLDDNALELALTVTAGDQAMPAMVGWHPWFRRRLLRDASVAAQLRFSAEQMYELDDTLIPTGRLIEPPPGPWDNCFTGMSQPLTLTWPAAVELSLTSSCDHWVIFDQREYAICVEPQSDAPDVFNRHPTVLEPGQSLTETFRIAWKSLATAQPDIEEATP
jgi:aldose 1-epimerase